MAPQMRPGDRVRRAASFAPSTRPRPAEQPVLLARHGGSLRRPDAPAATVSPLVTAGAIPKGSTSNGAPAARSAIATSSTNGGANVGSATKQLAAVSSKANSTDSTCSTNATNSADSTCGTHSSATASTDSSPSGSSNGSATSSPTLGNNPALSKRPISTVVIREKNGSVSPSRSIRDGPDANANFTDRNGGSGDTSPVIVGVCRKRLLPTASDADDSDSP